MNEKYVPLYRKYRPKNLQEVVGQEHVKKALTNAIELKKIFHAYLFTGPRGTGKTSMARILAKSLNCQNGPTITPCESCPSCLDIKNSTPIDVIEIDAASNRKVEDARNILEKIQYVPVNGKYKIYIIDEVHMLVKEAFNALLKTLEEPPENVIFILATTEPHKVLETITSRCQRFDFRRITTTDIVNHLKMISEKEDINIEEDALYTIAKSAAGGMRDSLALLDQVSVLDSSKAITTEDINKLLGRLSFDVLNKLANCIINSQIQDAIEQLENIYNSGNEPVQILTNLLGYLKNLLIIKNCAKTELLQDLTQLNDSQIKLLKSQTENIETHQITFLIEKTSQYIKELKTTTNQQLWLEIAIIDLANLTENTTLMALQERISNLEAGNVSAPVISKVMPVQAVSPRYTPAEKPSVKEKEIVNEPVVEKQEAKQETVAEEVSSPKPVQSEKINVVEEESSVPISKSAQPNQLRDLWASLLNNIPSSPTASLLNQHAAPIEINEDSITIGCKPNFLNMLNSESKRKSIEDGAKKLFNKSVNITIKAMDKKEIENISEKKNKLNETAKIQPVSKPKEQDTQPQETSDEEDFAEYELAKKKKSERVIQSDQVTMVMNLFNGKYIDD